MHHQHKDNRVPVPVPSSGPVRPVGSKLKITFHTQDSQDHQSQNHFVEKGKTDSLLCQNQPQHQNLDSSSGYVQVPISINGQIFFVQVKKEPSISAGPGEKLNSNSNNNSSNFTEHAPSEMSEIQNHGHGATSMPVPVPIPVATRERNNSTSNIQQYQVVIPEPEPEPAGTVQPSSRNFVPLPAPVSFPVQSPITISSASLKTLNSDHDYLTMTENRVPVSVISVRDSVLDCSTSSITTNRLSVSNPPSLEDSSDGVEELFSISGSVSGSRNEPNKIQSQSQPMLLLWNVGKNTFEKNNVTVNNNNNYVGKMYSNTEFVTNGAGAGTGMEDYSPMGSNTALTSETIYRCKRCLRTFPLHTIANYHYKTVHLGLNEYQCPWCKKCFPGCLKVHMELCSAKRANTAPILKRKSSKPNPASSSPKSSEQPIRQKRQRKSTGRTMNS